MTDASKISIDENGSNLLVGYCNENSTDPSCPKLFKGVIPKLKTPENLTVLDFDQSYVTTEDTHSNNTFEVVDLFGRHHDLSC